MLDRRLAELEEAEQELRAERDALQQGHRQPQNTEERESLQHERREIDRMKQQLERSQADAQASLDKQRAVLAHQEATLRNQRAELARMMEQLRALQDELRRPHRAELQTLSEENQRLRQALAELGTAGNTGASNQELDDARAEIALLRELLDDREHQLGEAQDQFASANARDTNAASLGAENELLKQLLAEKDTLVEELRAQAAPKPAKSPSELERYEAELNQYRQQLETDRGKLTTEIEQLRMKNQELDEATRELEMEMSRERAELARERTRMERMRDELKVDMEKMQREMGVRESLAPVQRLREEMSQKRPAARSLRGSDTPRP
jgi:chromosome segregation ATPase